jgi:penicillin amidase
LLKDWDFQQPADEPAASSAAAAFYNAVWRHLLLLTFDELPPDRRPDGGDRWWELMDALLGLPSSAWWDAQGTPDIEQRDQILWRAIDDAVKELTATQGADPAAWRWGKMHTLELEHATLGKSGIDVIEWLFNRGPVGVSGWDAIVNATGWSAADGYGVDAVPSMRMIVDLGDLDASRWISSLATPGTPSIRTTSTSSNSGARVRTCRCAGTAPRSRPRPPSDGAQSGLTSHPALITVSPLQDAPIMTLGS